jgi:PEGA domain
MKRILMASAVPLLAVLSFAPAASARGRIFVGVGTGFYAPGYYGWYGPAWYGPAWYGPGWYGPYARPYYYGRYSRENTGNVKISTHVKGGSIFVDGGYAGVTGKLKKFPLRPGSHTIELRDHTGHTFYHERVEVIRGRTVEIKPEHQS